MLLDGGEARLLRRDRVPRLLPHADADTSRPRPEASQALPEAHQRRLPVRGVLRYNDVLPVNNLFRCTLGAHQGDQIQIAKCL